MNARTYPRSVSVILALVLLGTIFQVAKAQGDPATFSEQPQPGIHLVDEAGLMSQADRAAIIEAETNTAMEHEETMK